MSENMKGFKFVNEVYKDPIRKVKELRGKTGRKIIGYICAYPPLEILTAADTIPFRVFGDVNEPITEGNRILPPVICSYVRSIVDLGMKGRFDFLDGLIWSHSCDCMHKGGFVYTSCVSKPVHYILEIPTTTSEEAINFFKYELMEFKGWLEKLLGREFSMDCLKEAIEKHNRQRELVKRLYDLKREDPPLITGTDTLKIISVIEALPVEEGNRILEEVLEEAEEYGSRPKKRGARLMIWGSIIDSPALLQIIEENGAYVVVDDTCVCSRQFWLHSNNPHVKTTGDLMENLAKRYLIEVKCPRLYIGSYGTLKKDYKRDLEERFGYLKDYISKWKVDGVILHSLRCCDVHGYEVPQVKDYLDMLGIPSIYIEPEYDAKTLPPLKTRIQAFLETLSQL
ncbi:2-hydroxyacyl-CoA dehydratase [Candidatus Bathyarchaeota archaeon]|nr:2-hydroxyacyl-CoA dehydratase [Candidatus Bathyarchaeota archaeon]